MNYLIYGAYGYTGTLIAEEAVRRGHEPILAGRNPEKLEPLGDRLGLETRVASLNNPQRLRTLLNEGPAVLHCAGPFARTAPPMVAACLDTGTHYLDITGEIPVFQELASRSAEAEEQNVCLLPGVGFDVVPTDCLARGLAEQCPEANTLEIAIYSVGGVSTGTLKTIIEQIGVGGQVRRDGRVVDVPPGWTSRTADFADHPRRVISIPTADVVTAGMSTGIPNVTAYLYLPALLRTALRLSRFATGFFDWELLQTLLKRAVDRWVPNPSAAAREAGRTQVWASVRTKAGDRQSARLQGPHAYTLTARAAVQAAERVVADGPVGFQTPGTAFGADFVDSLDGVETQRDLPTSESSFS
jgi:saccharopine dehydrogenase (NAD+, L-lysine-forming)